MLFPVLLFQNGFTPLHISAARGLVDICCELLDLGADIEAQDDVSAVNEPLLSPRYFIIPMFRNVARR